WQCQLTRGPLQALLPAFAKGAQRTQDEHVEGTEFHAQLLGASLPRQVLQEAQLDRAAVAFVQLAQRRLYGLAEGVARHFALQELFRRIVRRTQGLEQALEVGEGSPAHLLGS